MKAPQSLPKPENWQDFESLCLKLWSEIWQCPEIKIHGRSGQKQQGVDIYGVPRGEIQYCGIQCKLKDENTATRLTEKEILREVSLAEDFSPALKKFYITTTANRNAKIEAVVRNIDVERRKKGLFEVHVFFWEDIARLIYENPQTKDYYEGVSGFRNNFLAKVSFVNGSSKLIVRPSFVKRMKVYRILEKELDGKLNSMHTGFDFLGNLEGFNSGSNLGCRINRSYFPFSIRIENSGVGALENYLVNFSFEGEILNVENSNTVGIFSSSVYYSKDIEMNLEASNGSFKPRSSPLVGGDFIDSDEIFLLPNFENSEIKINWELLSSSYRSKGELILLVEPEIVSDIEEVIVESKDEVRVESEDIQEYLVIC